MALFFSTTSEGMMIKFTSLQQMMMPFYSFNSWMLWVGLETFAITGGLCLSRIDEASD